MYNIAHVSKNWWVSLALLLFYFFFLKWFIYLMLIGQTHPESFKYIISSYHSTSSSFSNFILQATGLRDIRDYSSQVPSSQVT